LVSMIDIMICIMILSRVRSPSPRAAYVPDNSDSKGA
jgi:hypothetical protein